jgi:hypothetical protein
MVVGGCKGVGALSDVQDSPRDTEDTLRKVPFVYRDAVLSAKSWNDWSFINCKNDVRKLRIAHYFVKSVTKNPSHFKRLYKKLSWSEQKLPGMRVYTTQNSNSYQDIWLGCIKVGKSTGETENRRAIPRTWHVHFGQGNSAGLVQYPFVWVFTKRNCWFTQAARLWKFLRHKPPLTEAVTHVTGEEIFI